MKHACSRPIAGAIGAVTAAATAALLLTFGPQRISLATAHTGDTQLASALERSAAAEPGHRALSALVYDQGRITFGGLGWYGFWSMMAFLGVLTIGFVYEWKKGALEWD